MASKHRYAVEIREEAIAAQAAGSDWCATIVEDKIRAIPARYRVRWDDARMRGTLIPMVTDAACEESE